MKCLNTTIFTNSSMSQRFDRQIRLWGSNGQKKINDANICLIGDYSLATWQEVAKNLVLSGIRNITVISTINDIQIENIENKSNIKLKGFIPSDNIFNYLKQLSSNNIIINQLNLSYSTLTKDIKNYNWSKHNVICLIDNFHDIFYNIFFNSINDYYSFNLLPPIISSYVIGEIAMIKLKIFENLFIFETHPNYKNPILRLDYPWPELKDFLNNSADILSNFNNLNSDSISDYPFVCILYTILRDYFLTNNNNNISNGNQNINIKKIKENIDTFYSKFKISNLQDINYSESKRFAYLAFTDLTINDKVYEMACIGENILSNFDYKKYKKSIDNYNLKILILLKALRIFMDSAENIINNIKWYPLSRDLSDMDASTKLYHKLKNIYKQKGLEDQRFLRKILQKHDNFHFNQINVDNDLIETFCSNIPNIVLIKPIDPPHNDQKLYLDILYYHYPHLKPLNYTFSESFLQQSNSKIVSLFALVGSITSNEVIKLITHHYIPINNTLLLENGGDVINTFST